MPPGALVRQVGRGDDSREPTVRGLKMFSHYTQSALASERRNARTQQARLSCLNWAISGPVCQQLVVSL
jgi:hypothetical protein